MNDRLRDAAERLRAAGFDSPRAEARVLWEHAQKLAQSELSYPPLEGGSKREALRGGVNCAGSPYPSPKNSFPASSAGSNFSTLPQGEGGLRERFDIMLQRRLKHEPIAYIAGHKEFWSLDFEVGPGVLTPRPETETLVEAALQEAPERDRDYRVLDLGTGTGCLLISFLSERLAAQGMGVDYSEVALGWARRNLARHGLERRAVLRQGDWEAADGRFDLVFSNPPYISTADMAGLPADVRHYEPSAALDGGLDGLDAYRALAPILQRHLAPEGAALLEIGAGQHHMVREILERQGLKVPRIVPDMAGIPRCVVARQG